MPAGEQIAGVDGIFELIDASNDTVIGEIPCLQSWNIDANGNLAERGERCMKSNGDDEEIVTPAVAATATIEITDGITDGDTVTIDGRVYRFKDTPSTAGDVAISEVFGGGGVDAGLTMDNLATEMAGGTTYNVTAHATVAAVRFPGALASTTRLDLAATTGGTGGNAIPLLKSGEAITISGATLTGGADAVTAPASLYKSQTVVSKSWSGTAEFFWQENQSIPAALSLDPTNVGDLLKVKLYPNDRATGKILYSGTVRLETVTANAEAGGDVKTTCTFKGTGALVSSEYA